MNTKHVPTVLMIAGIAILAFSYLQPNEQSILKRNTARELLNLVKQPETLSVSKNIETLRGAYTGKWFKNKISTVAEAGIFSFTPPVNTRNTVEAKKVDDKKKADLKKKMAQKKKLQAFKIAKRNYDRFKKSRRSLFDFDRKEASIPDYVYYPYNQNAQNQPQPAAEEEETKKWTLEELYANILTAQNVSELVSLYKKSEIGAALFYGTIEKLFASQTPAHHTLGFTALTQTPSIASFIRHVTFLETETTEEIRTAASAQLDIYKEVSHLPVVNSGLSNPERDVQSASALFLQQVAEFLIQTANTTPTAVETPETRTPSSLNARQLERYRIILKQSASILTTLLQSGNLDSELVSVYTQSKSRIEQFLALSETPTSQSVASF